MTGNTIQQPAGALSTQATVSLSGRAVLRPQPQPALQPGCKTIRLRPTLKIRCRKLSEGNPGFQLFTTEKMPAIFANLRQVRKLFRQRQLAGQPRHFGRRSSSLVKHRAG